MHRDGGNGPGLDRETVAGLVGPHDVDVPAGSRCFAVYKEACEPRRYPDMSASSHQEPPAREDLREILAGSGSVIVVFSTLS